MHRKMVKTRGGEMSGEGPQERGGKACLTMVFLTVNTRESGENERG